MVVFERVVVAVGVVKAVDVFEDTSVFVMVVEDVVLGDTDTERLSLQEKGTDHVS